MKQNIFLGLVLLLSCALMQAGERDVKGTAADAEQVRVNQQLQQNRPTTDDIESEFHATELSDEELKPIIQEMLRLQQKSRAQASTTQQQ